jgi:hypothetical protein
VFTDLSIEEQVKKEEKPAAGAETEVKDGSI